MAGDATFNNLTVNNATNAGRITVADHVVTGNSNVNNLNVSGTASLTNMSVTNLSLPGTLEVTGLTTLSNVSASGTLGVAGASTLGDVSASGTLEVAGATTLGAVTTNGVLTLNGDVNALVFAAATQVSSVGNTDIRNSSGIDGDSLAIQGSPVIQGDIFVSGNVYVGGNVFTDRKVLISDVLDSTGLVPTGQYVPDSQDVFNLQNSDSCYPPAHFEIENDILMPIFTDSTKTTYINKGTTYASDSTSLLMEFPTSNVYEPTFTALNSASVSAVYSNIYANANASYALTSHYSAQPVDGGTVFSPDDIRNLSQRLFGFYTDRGYSLPTPDYNVNYKNMFVAYVGYTNCRFSIEFEYNQNMSVPSNVHVAAITDDIYSASSNKLYSGFLCAYKNLAVTDSNVFLQPTTIPVTTDPAVFSSVFGTPNANMALYDPTKKEIHIYFDGSSNTYGSGNTTPAFTTGTDISQITWNEVCELSHFEGSFALQKKRAQVTDSNRPFAPANSVEDSAFLVQTSNNIIITSNVYKNGTEVTSDALFYSQSVSHNMMNDGAYSGVVVSKVGSGTDKFDIFSMNIDAPAAYSAEYPTILLLEKNPYSQVTQYFPIPSYIGIYNSDQLGQFYGKTTYANVFTDTPEMLVANMSSDMPALDSPSAVELVLAHELSHGLRDFGTGIHKNINTEGHAVSVEMMYSKKLIPQLVNAFRHVQLTAYFNSMTRGAWPVEKRDQDYVGELHLLGGESRVWTSFAAQYGEAMFYNYVVEHYDKNIQIERYTNDLVQQKLKEGVLDAGFPLWTTFVDTTSIKVSQLAYDEALKAVTAAQGEEKSLSQVYSDFVVSQALLRNNSTIPDKYKTIYPYWLYNRDAPWISNLGEAVYFSAVGSVNMWSDVLDGIPLGRNAQIPFWDWTLNGTQNDTIVPIWPKEGSDATAVPFSNGPGINNLGSWADPDTRDAWTYTSNTYVNTPLVHQLEDMASFTYIMPIFSDSANLVYGTQHYVSNVAITVTKGDWVFKVVQFIPDGADGTFIESNVNMDVNITDSVFNGADGTWSSGTAQTIDINFSTMDTRTTTSSGTVDSTGFQKNCHGTDWHGVHVWHFPRLLCINKKNYDYGVYRNVLPNDSIYTGYMTMQATIV